MNLEEEIVIDVLGNDVFDTSQPIKVNFKTEKAFPGKNEIS